MEEMPESKKRDRSFENKNTVPNKEKVKVANPPKPFKSTDKEFQFKMAKYDSYTPLTRSRESILEEVCNNELLTLLRPGKTPGSVDRSKECKWHPNYGHTCENSRMLSDKLEDLVQARHLEHYVRKENYRGGRGGPGQGRGGYYNRARDENQQSGNQVQNQENQHGERGSRVKGVINTISGGFAGGGSTSSARRRYVKAIQSVNSVSGKPSKTTPPIMFTNDDFRGVDPSQDDPMVITVELAN